MSTYGGSYVPNFGQKEEVLQQYDNKWGAIAKAITQFPVNENLSSVIHNYQNEKVKEDRIIDKLKKIRNAESLLKNDRLLNTLMAAPGPDDDKPVGRGKRNAFDKGPGMDSR